MLLPLAARRPLPRTWRRAVFGALLILSSLAGAATQAQTAGGLSLSACRLEHPAGLAALPARCGTLRVAENPAEPQGRQIGLAVAMVPALDHRRAREPLFVIAGGPGQAARDFYAAYAGAFAPVLRNHDLVLVDQRGTGGSNRLRCDFPADFDLGSSSADQIRALSNRCLLGLAGRPEYYTTSIAVRDLEAVRAALGAPRISLYGVSYGTRVAEHYVRRFPAHVAAVVLDGALPPDRSIVTQTPMDAERALEALFARCRSQVPCNRAFPDLSTRFAALRAELAAHPRTLTVPDPSSGQAREVRFDGAALIGTVRLLDYYGTTSALLPWLLDRAARGDATPLAAQLLMLSAHLDTQVAYGMNAAVSCTEDVPAVAHADRAAAAATYLGTQQLDGLHALCEGWPRGVVDADLYGPISAAGPALVLSGQLDPVTPPQYGEQAAAGFRDHVHVVVPGQGHGQLAVGCAPRVIAAFLDAGTTRDLDTRCLAAAGPAPFVIDLAGPAP